MVGENYAQEAVAKLAAATISMAGEASARLHFIGRLQSNKVRQLAPIVDVWESIDRASLLDEIAKRRPGATVLVQVNATGEDDKGGCPPDAVAGLVARGLNLNLDVNGVMTVGPTSGDATETRRAFTVVKALADGM